MLTQSDKHMVAEAMTKATVRVCNKCKTPFWKEGGCNRMTCARCGNQQCFVCSLNLKGVSGHFMDHGCPLFDDTDIRLHTEAATAREKTLHQLLPNQFTDSAARGLIPVSYHGHNVPDTFDLITVDRDAYLRHSDLDFPIPCTSNAALSISKDRKLTFLHQHIAQSFGLKLDQFRLWSLAHRENRTIRLERPIPLEESTGAVATNFRG
jgi:hypothetical protein